MKRGGARRAQPTLRGRGRGAGKRVLLSPLSLLRPGVPQRILWHAQKFPSVDRYGGGDVDLLRSEYGYLCIYQLVEYVANMWRAAASQSPPEARP